MSLPSPRNLFFLPFILLWCACANISHPTGGDKDITPPKLLSVAPADSQLHARLTKIELKFDEFVNVTNVTEEVQLSPLLPFSPSVEAFNRKVIVKIPDSLLKDNTTYRISFGKAIVDVHENNAFTGYNYIFSTGDYFDSLKLSGQVINAATGKSDTAAMILLYEANKSDSAVLHEKPLYAMKTNPLGNFLLEGLPDKTFKIYALHDKNNNLMYDGKDEDIAFYDFTVHPADSAKQRIELYIFSENDSVNNNENLQPANKKRGGAFADNADQKNTAAEGFTYIVNVDTSDKNKRSQDVTQPLQITFNKKIASINTNRINLTYDSAGTIIEMPVLIKTDSTNNQKILIETSWKENSAYTLRLLKNFAVDSTGTEALPSKYVFHTKADYDYSKLHVHLPTKYSDDQFVFVLQSADKIIYQKTVTDTMLHFLKLPPAEYNMHIIVDKNKNGKWDAGKLLEKIQPEKIIANDVTVKLKPGWENTVDFRETSLHENDKISPLKR